MNLFLATAISLLPLFSYAASDVLLKIGIYEHISSLSNTSELKQFVQEALRKENIRIDYVPVPTLRGEEMVQSGNLDGHLLTGQSSAKSFSNIVLLKPPLIFSNLKVIFSRSNKDFLKQNLSDLQGCATLNNFIISDLVKKRNLRLIEVSTASQALELIEKKRADYTIISEDVFMALTMNAPDMVKKFQISPEPFVQASYYFSLNKKQSHLIPKIQKALRQAIHKDLEKYPEAKKMINKKF